MIFIDKRFIKKSFLFYLILIVGLLSYDFALAKKWKRVKIAFEPYYPPFTYVKKDGKVAGMEVDIAKSLCREMKVRCVHYKQDWDGLIPGLLSRKYDAVMAGMSITEERKKRITFSDPYFFLGAIFVGKKNQNIAISNNIRKNKMELKGKKIGVQNSTTMEYHLNRHYSDDSDIRKYPSNEKIMLDLLSGRVDIGFFESLIASYILKEKEYSNTLSMIGPAFFNKDLVQDGVGIGMRKRDRDLHNLINRAMSQIKKNGKYKKILSQYITNDEYRDMINLSK